jgi:hypothetical protein
MFSGLGKLNDIRLEVAGDFLQSTDTTDQAAQLAASRLNQLIDRGQVTPGNQNDPQEGSVIAVDDIPVARPKNTVPDRDLPGITPCHEFTGVAGTVHRMFSIPIPVVRQRRRPGVVLPTKHDRECMHDELVAQVEKAE